MNRYLGQGLFGILLLAVAAVNASAAGVTIPTTFVANTAAKAAEVNANFSAVKTAVDDNDSRIAALETAVATLQQTVTTQATAISNQATEIASLQSTVVSQDSRIAALESTVSTHTGQIAGINHSSTMELAPYLTVDTISDSRGPLVRFSGVNLQLVNGTGSTQSANGRGNLILGYDLVRNDGQYFCSKGVYTDQVSCENDYGTWAVSLKSGSHNLVMGDYDNYSQYGSLVSGNFNTINGYYSVAIGGALNIAGNYGTVFGGTQNTARGSGANVIGGMNNTASGELSSITGGRNNTASGQFSSILGGNTQSAALQDQTVPALP